MTLSEQVGYLSVGPPKVRVSDRLPLTPNAVLVREEIVIIHLHPYRGGHHAHVHHLTEAVKVAMGQMSHRV